jgi:hypothetical protein
MVKLPKIVNFLNASSALACAAVRLLCDTRNAMADAAAAKKRRLEALMGGAPAGDRAGPFSFADAGAPSEAAAPPAGAVFEAQANEALSFRLVRTAEELDTAPAFHPEFTHQVFREDETIFGYRDLKARARVQRSGVHARAGVCAANAARRGRAAGAACGSAPSRVAAKPRARVCMSAPADSSAACGGARRSQSRCTRSPSTRLWRSATAARRPPRWAASTTWRRAS